MYLRIMSRMIEARGSIPTTSENELSSEALQKQHLVLERTRAFIESVPVAQKEKVMAQYKLILRKLFGNGAFQGSGIESVDAHHLASQEGTGFLQLGKLHFKGPENEGTVDFFDRYGWVGATTKHTDLILIFEPDTAQIHSLTANPDKLPEETWTQIEKVSQDRSSVQGLRPGTDVKVVVFDPTVPDIEREVALVKQRFPELANKFLSVAQFAETLSEQGLLPGETPVQATIDFKSFIDDVANLPLPKEAFYDFVIHQVLPELRSAEKATVIAEMLQQQSFISSREFVEKSPKLPLLRSMVDVLSDSEIMEVSNNLTTGYRPEYLLPLVFLKYTVRGQKLPPEIRNRVLLIDTKPILDKLATSSEEEWNTLVSQIQEKYNGSPMLEYFLSVTKDKEHSKRQEIAAAKAEFDTVHQSVGLMTAKEDILEQDVAPVWKTVLFTVRQRFTPGEPVLNRKAKKATEQFIKQSENGVNTSYAVWHDLGYLLDNLGSSWPRDESIWSRNFSLQPTPEKTALIHALIPTVVPQLAEKLKILQKYYEQAATTAA